MYTYKISKTLSEIFNCEFEPISDQVLNYIPEDSICGGTDYVSGLVWITNGEENSYLDPKKMLPEGWRYGRTMQHMAYTNPDKWKSITSESALKQWNGSSGRRELHSTKMKKLWEDNREYLTEKARKNGDNGLKGKTHPRALLLEYKGVEYYGWRELKEATDVTKNLYKKYYLNGIDPEPRIGKDGPAASTLTMDKIHQGGSA